MEEVSQPEGLGSIQVLPEVNHQGAEGSQMDIHRRHGDLGPRGRQQPILLEICQVTARRWMWSGTPERGGTTVCGQPHQGKNIKQSVLLCVHPGKLWPISRHGPWRPKLSTPRAIGDQRGGCSQTTPRSKPKQSRRTRRGTLPPAKGTQWRIDSHIGRHIQAFPSHRTLTPSMEICVCITDLQEGGCERTRKLQTCKSDVCTM